MTNDTFPDTAQVRLLADVTTDSGHTITKGSKAWVVDQKGDEVILDVILDNGEPDQAIARRDQIELWKEPT